MQGAIVANVLRPASGMAYAEISYEPRSLAWQALSSRTDMSARPSSAGAEWVSCITPSTRSCGAMSL